MKTYQDEPDEKQADTFDEYSTHDKPQQISFHDRYEYDEREGPPEEDEEEEHGYVDDPDNGTWNELDYRRR